jgi:hypothetical protein
MRTKLDMDKIAKALGAQRRGKVVATGGHFGATQLAAEVQARFRVPRGGGRPTDPSWTERRLLPLSARTLKKLEQVTAVVRKHGKSIDPMQLAALIVEKSAESLDSREAESLLGPSNR